MALCLKPQIVWVPYTNAATPRYQTTVFIPDTSTPVEQCSYVVIQGSEIPPHVFIDNQTDAVTIASAFIGLIAVAGIYRFLARQLWDLDVGPSDEKH